MQWPWSATRRLWTSLTILKALRQVTTKSQNHFPQSEFQRSKKQCQDDENKVKAQELKKVCKLNRAACQLKLQLFAEAKASCDAVLKDDSHNVKALFRKAQAELGLKMFLECAEDVKKVLDLEPQNKEARALAKEAAKGQKEEDQKSKGVFGKMCSALGTGPIREPYVDRRFDFDAEERLQKEAVSK